MHLLHSVNQALCISLGQTALNKLPNQSTKAEHRTEMLVNAFSICSQNATSLYYNNLYFIDEAQTHTLRVHVNLRLTVESTSIQNSPLNSS